MERVLSGGTGVYINFLSHVIVRSNEKKKLLDWNLQFLSLVKSRSDNLLLLCEKDFTERRNRVLASAFSPCDSKCVSAKGGREVGVTFYN